MTPLLICGLAAALSATACNSDSGFRLRKDGTIAVVVGDFDNLQESFNRLSVDTVRYDGIISTATWVEDADDFTAPALRVENLFSSERNQELLAHGSVFVASGSRGFGIRQYNSLADDNQVVADPESVANALAFVRAGGVLVLTDWTYDLVPLLFPGAIDFWGDESVLDAAQLGDVGTVQARVVDDELIKDLDLTDDGALSLDFNFSYWAVMESVDESDERVKVWMRGDVSLRDGDGGGTIELTDVPLLVTVDVGGELGGRLVYSSFHFDAQNPVVIDKLLQSLVGDFDQSEVVKDRGDE
ncbi:MAG: hypothetical protein AB8H79_13110 [Myxococcota bacterium]